MARKTPEATDRTSGGSPAQRGQPLVVTEVHLPRDLVELLRDVSFARFVRHDLGEHSISRVIADVLERHRDHLEAEAKMIHKAGEVPATESGEPKR